MKQGGDQTGRERTIAWLEEQAADLRAISRPPPEGLDAAGFAAAVLETAASSLRAGAGTVVWAIASGSRHGWQVPAGFKLVPEEPTEAMRIAALKDEHLPEFIGDYPLYEKLWRAMYAAAPEPPSAAKE